jgi:hypothetical protein
VLLAKFEAAAEIHQDNAACVGEVRADRMRSVHDVIAAISDDVLGGETDPVPAPG